VRAARSRAVEGGGPTLIEALTMRMHGHAAHDDMKYVPLEQVEKWRLRDPVERQEKRLGALGVDVDGLRASVAEEIDAAAKEALAGPMPDPESAVLGVFCEGEAEPLGDGQAPWSGFAGGGAGSGSSGDGSASGDGATSGDGSASGDGATGGSD
jgi:TPP-dependent pyruvate/acetoin dehydrogenase alpha subunit